MIDKKTFAYDLIKDKLEYDSFFTYKEIAQITGYHPKYLLKLKKQIIDGTFKLEHGNKNKPSYNAISEIEELKIIELYKRSKANIMQFKKFYGSRSYSCIYNILKKHGLIRE